MENSGLLPTGIATSCPGFSLSPESPHLSLSEVGSCSSVHQLLHSYYFNSRNFSLLISPFHPYVENGSYWQRSLSCLVTQVQQLILAIKTSCDQQLLTSTSFCFQSQYLLSIHKLEVHSLSFISQGEIIPNKTLRNPLYIAQINCCLPKAFPGSFCSHLLAEFSVPPRNATFFCDSMSYLVVYLDMYAWLSHQIINFLRVGTVSFMSVTSMCLVYNRKQVSIC